MAQVHRISSLDDPRLEPYRALKDRELARQPGGRFIAEGELVVRRLLASDYPAESVLVAERRGGEISAIVPGDVPLYSVPDSMIHQVVGYRFHQGVIACGRRRSQPPLEELASRWTSDATLVICPDLNNTENLGLLIRIAAGFGAGAMILGPRSCDPFFRQAVRVSMGAVFRLPIVRSEDLERDLQRLRSEWQVELLATVLDPSAEPLSRAGRTGRVALLFGNEAQGLDPGVVKLCDRRVTIEMKLGTDSLNVAVAAGIILYHFTR